MLEGTDELKGRIVDYFSNLFSSEVPQPDPVVLSRVKRCVTQNMNDALLAPFTPEDVKKALFDIGDLKAPGPDGLHGF